MSTSTSSQQLLGLNPCNRSIQDTDGNVVRPQPALLKLLHTAGAKGHTFTVKQVMHFLGQYIMVKQLYDKQQQHIVHCGTDELGKLLGIATFSVKDPSPLYEMLKKNLSRVPCTGLIGNTFIIKVALEQKEKANEQEGQVAFPELQ